MGVWKGKEVRMWNDRVGREGGGGVGLEQFTVSSNVFCSWMTIPYPVQECSDALAGKIRERRRRIERIIGWGSFIHGHSGRALNLGRL